MQLAIADETYLKQTTSRCPTCLCEIPADVIQRGGAVYMRKKCEAHGDFEVKIANDPTYYYKSLGSRDGGSNECCGSGCGCATSPALSEAREEESNTFEILSSCIALIEIVDSCNLKCPTCYASSPFGIDDEIDCVSFENFRSRVQGVLDRKGSIDILQLSGGEPTIHPQFFEILEWSLREPRIGYVLINTNAVRIARENAFREQLGDLRRTRGKFELYMQFDGPQEAGQFDLRGADLRDVRRKAIDEAGALGVPSTLAMTVTPTNLAHLGDTVRFGVERPHVRGVCFQPMFTSGRTVPIESSTPGLNGCASDPGNIFVGDIIHNVIRQAGGLLSHDDFTPLPCGDPNCHTIGYLIRTKDGPKGIGSLVDLKSVQGFLENRVDYRVEDLAKCGCDNEPLGELLKGFEIGPESPFRIFIKPFMDAWTFDQDRIDRCCTHVIRPDGKLDSFCRYYLERQATFDA